MRPFIRAIITPPAAHHPPEIFSVSPRLNEYFSRYTDTFRVNSMIDDFTVIQQCRAGDRQAYRYLVERYQAQAIGHALMILGNRDDALDAVQDAFVDAFRSLDGFDLSRNFYPWFYVLVRNRCYKLAARRPAREQPGLEGNEVLEIPAGEHGSDAERLNGALLELNPKDREILTLKYLDGLSYDELAMRLEIPRGTVMSRLFHARRRLRLVLDDDAVKF